MAKRILIVDDALFMRTMLKRILSEAGYEIVGEADNGASGVQKFTQLKPDAVLMDITMPIMDGISALKTIIKNDPTARVIMCTALSQQNLVMEALQAGAKDYILKPFNPLRVIEGVAKALDDVEAAA